jgi:hypothetical protein
MMALCLVLLLIVCRTRVHGQQNITPWVLNPTLSEPNSSSYYGYYGLSTDGSNIVVGDYAFASYTGAAYVYSMNASGAWPRRALLNNPRNRTNDLFGYCTAISSDVLVVGAFGVDSYKGAVYVYRLISGQWIWKQTLNTTISSAYFGFSCSMDGSRLVVGAYYAYIGRGTVFFYDFNNSSGLFGNVQQLNGTGLMPNDYFGSAVDISGDYAVVGAPYADPNNIQDGGACFVFVRSGSAWLQQGGALTAADKSVNAYFGNSVSIDGAGLTLVVGAYGTNSSNGAAYVFKWNGTTWSQQAKLVGRDVSASFGITVAVSGNTIVCGKFMAKWLVEYAYLMSKWRQFADIILVGLFRYN